MDLKQAGTLLGITPNAVRHRAKKGQSPFNSSDKTYEIDNRQKWWVFLDPDALPASNDDSNSTSNVTSKRTSNGAKSLGEIKALQGHVQTLSESLTLERAEVARLRLVEAQAVDLKVENASLKSELQGVRDRLSDLQKLQAAAPKPPGEEVASQAIIPPAAPPGPGKAPERGKGWPQWLTRLWR